MVGGGEGGGEGGGLGGGLGGGEGGGDAGGLTVKLLLPLTILLFLLDIDQLGGQRLKVSPNTTNQHNKDLGPHCHIPGVSFPPRSIIVIDRADMAVP